MGIGIPSQNGTSENRVLQSNITNFIWRAIYVVHGKANLVSPDLHQLYVISIIRIHVGNFGLDIITDKGHDTLAVFTFM